MRVKVAEGKMGSIVVEGEGSISVGGEEGAMKPHPPTKMRAEQATRNKKSLGKRHSVVMGTCFPLYFTVLSPCAVSGNRIRKLPLYLSLQSVKQQNAICAIISAL